MTFDRIPLSEVIKHLAESARNGDPEGEGVNFIINPNVDPPVNGSTNIEPVEVNSIGINIHPAMVDVRLADVMDAIVQVASPPIKYSIEDYAVVFSLRTEHATPLYTRWFRLDIGKLCQRLMSKGLLDAGALDSLTESPDEGSFAVPIGAAPDGARFRYVTSTNDLSLIGGATRVFIQSAGVDLNPPKAMFLSMGQGHLLVRATLQDLDVVETALQNLDPLPREANKSKRPPVVPPGPDTTRADTNSASFTPMPSVATHAVHDSQSTLTIQVLRDGSYVLGTNKMDLPVLRQHVFEIKTLSLDKRARISADQDAPFSAVVAVMNLLKESNISAVIAGIQVPVVGRTEQSDATVCTRIFKVEPHSFARGLEGILGTPAVSSVQEAIRSALSLAGVKVNPPNSIFYNDSAGTILVRATPRELDIVEQTLQSLSPQTSMIVVAVKFVEVPERLLEDPLKSAYGISRSDGQNGAVLSPAQMTEVLELLRANSNVQLLTSPNVATLSGRQAQIQSADVRTVVTGIKPEALIPPGVDSTNASGSEVFELKSVPFGPMLDIVPFVEADGVTVSLMAKASMIEFLGYRNTPSSGEVSAYVNGKEERVTLPLPQFRHRHISFNSRVRDGFTLVFGNPSDEHGHPVEHLGDGQKKLLVFITPTIIDPAGNRIHPEGVVPFQINSLSKRP